MISEVVKTIGEQLTALNPLFQAEFDVKELIAMNENTLRLHSRSKRGIINVDISYNHGSDLYDIKAYRLTNHGLDAETIFNNTDIFAESLDTALDEIFRSTK